MEIPKRGSAAKALARLLLPAPLGAERITRRGSLFNVRRLLVRRRRLILHHGRCSLDLNLVQPQSLTHGPRSRGCAAEAGRAICLLSWWRVKILNIVSKIKTGSRHPQGAPGIGGNAIVMPDGPWAREIALAVGKDVMISRIPQESHRAGPRLAVALGPAQAPDAHQTNETREAPIAGADGRHTGARGAGLACKAG